MSETTGSEQSSAERPGPVFPFTDKPHTSFGPRTVVHPERRGPSAPTGPATEMPASAILKQLFPVEPELEPVDSAAGLQLGHFVIEERIGMGGMGAVFRAVDQRLQRVVALKVLAPGQSHDSASVQRFLNEARASARLDDDNIARVYFVGEDQGLHFIAFEYVTGTNIRELIQTNGRLEVSEAVNYTLQIATALRHTSVSGVIHRDIKPSNIIITPGGRAKLVDLGLARKESSDSAGELTLAGTTLGTFDYISPEQAKDPRNVDIRSDIYSLGCTLYHMLTGEPPYPEGTVLQKLLDHQGKDPPDPAKKNRSVPRELSAIVEKMMASDPRHRFATPEQLIHELMPVASALGMRGVSPETLIWTTSKVEKPRFWERHLGWMATAAVLLIIVVMLERYPGIGQKPLTGPIAKSKIPDAESKSTPPYDNSIDPLQPPSKDGTTEPAPSIAENKEGKGPDASVTEGPHTPAPPPSVNNKGDAKTTVNASGSDKPNSSDVATQTVPMPNESPMPADDLPLISIDRKDVERKSFVSLEAACLEAKDGDVIELRFNGRRPGEPDRPLSVKKKKIFIRAADGFRPLIEFEAEDDQTRMITLLGGSIELINVDLRMSVPENYSTDPWALISLNGSESVRMQGVTVTIDNPGGRMASVFELIDGPGANLATMKMMQDGQPVVPPEFDITIGNSIIRGGCDLFVTKHTQPGSFEISQSVVAIDGTLLNVIGSLDMPADPNSKLELRMEHVTSLVGNGLVRLDSGDDGRNLIPVHVLSARNNIFAAKSESSPLVSMTGSTDVQDFRRLFLWRGENNFYDRFVTFKSIASNLSTTGSAAYDFEDWKSVSGSSTATDGIVWKNEWWQNELSRIETSDLELDQDDPALKGATAGTSVGADLTELAKLRPVSRAGPDPETESD